MDSLKKLRRQIRLYFLAVLAIQNCVLAGSFWILSNYTGWSLTLVLGASLALGILAAFVITQFFSNFVTQPIRALWHAVLHLSPTEQGVTAPKIEDLKLGRELVASLVAQVYQLASTANQSKAATKNQADGLRYDFVAQNLPLPLFIMDASETIRFANDAAAQYIGIAAADMIGKNVYMVLDMSFPSEDTFDVWLKSAKAKSATAVSSWNRVRLNVREEHPDRLFDLAAHYNRDNPEHNETMLVMFDHTKQYSQDNQSISFMALSVHELRAPLTLLRGYIEVFEDELGPTITDPELKGFMLKMHTMAEQLTAFVNNILNVARIDDDQLELKLQPEDWGSILKSSLDMINLRAEVRGITLKCTIAQDLPPVGIDRLSIREVISNLIDNAIKYSNTSKVIEIKTYLNKEGLVETTVQDFGFGISTSVLPNLFTKFYRDHRNRAQIGGTGLGLYLCKAIIAAHGGSLWVRSREGTGSTFGFTIIPYAQLEKNIKRSSDQEIVRRPHGWIKNHSLYRR